MKADNLRGIAGVARVFIWIVLATALISALATVGWLVTYVADTGSPLLLATASITQVAMMLVFLLSVIPILIWIYRAHANLANAGLDGLRHSAGWAVASYFVPFANFVVPFGAMRELYNRSAGEPQEFGHISVGAVTSWWACQLGAVVVWIIVAVSALIDALPGVYLLTPFWARYAWTVLMLALLAGSAWFLQRIVREVTEAQQSLVNVAATFD